MALRKKLEVTLDYIKSIGRKIQSFINFNISFKFVKVEIRSCCKAERPFIRLRFIPQQTHWWRRQEELQSCEDGPMISGVLKPNLLQLPIHIHSRLHSYIFVDSIDRFFNCLFRKRCFCCVLLKLFSDPTFFSYILSVIKVDNPKSSHWGGKLFASAIDTLGVKLI